MSCGAGLHLDREIPGVQMVRRGQSVPKLNSAEVSRISSSRRVSRVADAEVVLVKCKTFWDPTASPRDREVGSADFLPAKEVADGINRLKLEIEIWFKMKFHSRLE